MFLSRNRDIAILTCRYTPFLTYVDLRASQATTERLLIMIYAHFLARFFFICDERQVQPVKQWIEETAASGDAGWDERWAALFDRLLAQFTMKEKYAFERIFNHPLLGIPMPPIAFTDGPAEEGSRFVGKYTFRLLAEQDGRLVNKLSLGLIAPNTVLLPTTIVGLYGYIADKIGSEWSEQLRHVMKVMVSLSEQADIRSMSWLHNAGGHAVRDVLT